jgi:hypothetical protein
LTDIQAPHTSIRTFSHRRRLNVVSFRPRERAKAGSDRHQPISRLLQTGKMRKFA